MIGTWDDAAVYTLRETVTRMTSSMGASLFLIRPGGRKSEALAKMAIRALPGHLLNMARIAYLDDGRRLGDQDYRRLAKLWGPYASLECIETTPEEQDLLRRGVDDSVEALLGIPSLRTYLYRHEVRTIITGHMGSGVHVRSFDLRQEPKLRREAWELFPTLLVSDMRDRMRSGPRRMVVNPFACWTTLELVQLEEERSFVRDRRHLVVSLSKGSRPLFVQRILGPHKPLEISPGVFMTQDENQTAHRWIIAPYARREVSMMSHLMQHVVPWLSVADDVLILGKAQNHRNAVTEINTVLAMFSASVGRIPYAEIAQYGLYELLGSVRHSLFKRDLNAFYGQLHASTEKILGVSPHTLEPRTRVLTRAHNSWRYPETIGRFPCVPSNSSKRSVNIDYHERNPVNCINGAIVTVLGKKNFWKTDDLRMSQLGRITYLRNCDASGLSTKSRSKGYRIYTGTLKLGNLMPSFFDDVPFVVYSDCEILGCGQFHATHNCVL